MLCECGEFVEGSTFKDYIETSIGPSTRTFGHSSCGLIFNFIDGPGPRRYSTRTELKRIASKFAKVNEFDLDLTARFLLEVDRLKTSGTLSDQEILKKAYNAIK